MRDEYSIEIKWGKPPNDVRFAQVFFFDESPEDIFNLIKATLEVHRGLKGKTNL